MKRLILIIILLTPTICFAQDRCDWQITNVAQDQLRGSIVVSTEYKLDGFVVFHGETRYDEESGTPLHVSRMIRKDVQDECAYLLKTPLIADNFYNKPGVIKKKLDTKELLKKLQRVKGKKGVVKK